MTWQNKLEKIKRWANIWLSQFRVLCIKNQRPQNTVSGKIVVIKIDAIGDFLIWLDSASQYRECYPNYNITLICNTACEEIAEHTGFFDRIIAIKNKKFEADNSYKKEVLRILQKQNCNVLLQPAYSRTVDMDILACSIPADEKIGFVADESRENLSRYLTFGWVRKRLDKIYDKLIPSGEEDLMELERNARFIRGLGHDFMAGYPTLLPSCIEEGILPEKPYAVLFPGASSEKKMWPIERFAKVGKYLIKQKDWDIYLCGSNEEAYLYERFIKAMGHSAQKDRVHNYFGKTSLLELAEVIRHAKLFVGNDTSGIHFAAAVNTKGICILGEFAYGRFLPYRCERDCAGHEPIIVCHAGMSCAGCAHGTMTQACKKHLLTTGRHLCIENVSVKQVIEQI